MERASFEGADMYDLGGVDEYFIRFVKEGKRECSSKAVGGLIRVHLRSGSGAAVVDASLGGVKCGDDVPQMAEFA